MTKNLLLSLSFAALLAVSGFAIAQDNNAPVTTENAAESAPVPASGGESNPGAEATQPADTTADEPGPIGVSEETPAKAAPAAAEHAAPADEGSSSHHIDLRKVDWSFNGPFGTFDRAALQRGFQVYKDVCAACHSMNRVAYRNLSALGYNEGEIKTIAAEATVMDGPNDEGEMFERPARPADHFKAPFANDNAARYANNGALPPDLSLITRARGDGSNYVYSLLTGYEEAPADVAVSPGMHYNKYFAGHQIAMAAPLIEGGPVTYGDDTPATVDQMAKDVATFLTWASEPAMEERKQTGVKVLIFLLVFSVLMYLTKRKVWKDIH